LAVIAAATWIPRGTPSKSAAVAVDPVHTTSASLLGR
jgi:hypothetical protein